MEDEAGFELALRLFLAQHAWLHSARLEDGADWSFEDEVFRDLDEADARCIPRGEEHSIAWLIWHIARCEDITLNLLVAGSPQVLHQHGWLERVNSPLVHTGNAMIPDEVEAFSRAVQLDNLRAYRLAVGRRTRQIVRQLQPADLRRRVDAARLEQVRAQGAVLDAAWGIAEYWGRRDAAGLLLMPATRHPLVHLNQALQVKRRLRTA
ncbi:MAG: DinB family protein [Chloroflexota bacterium]